MDQTRRQMTKLVGTSRDLLALVEDGCARVKERPDDLFAIVATFILLNSIRDWAKHEGGTTSNWRGAPYYEAVREIANGTKHLHLRSKDHPDPHVEDLTPEGDWDTLDWGDLGRQDPMVSVLARRFEHEKAHWRSALGILEEAIAWWQVELN